MLNSSLLDFSVPGQPSNTWGTVWVTGGPGDCLILFWCTCFHLFLLGTQSLFAKIGRLVILLPGSHLLALKAVHENDPIQDTQIFINF